MKRSLFALVLILCLILCSCAPAISGAPESTPPSEEPTATPTQPTEPQPTDPPATEPPSFPMGDTGAVTDGALRAFPLDIGIRCNAYLWGDVALFYNANQCQIRSLEDGSLIANGPGIWTDSVTVTDDYIIYYIYPKHQIIFRDKNLETVNTVNVTVSDDVTDMLFTQDGKKAFYHNAPHNTIVELDIATGDKREIPVDGAPIWSLSGFAFNTLYYWGKDNNQDYYAFIDLSSGEYLGKDTQMTRLQTWDNGYYLCRAENGVAHHQVVIESTERSIEPQKHENLHYDTWALPQANSLFALHSYWEKPTVVLELYDLTTGECTNSLTVDLGQPCQQCTDVFVDPSGEYIWLCMKVGNTSDYQMVLYRWDFRANAVTE